MSGLHWVLADSLDWLLYDHATNERWWICQDEHGVYTTVRPWPATAGQDSIRLWFPFPVQRGNSGVDDTGVNWFVSTTDTTITVPAGTFHCIRYDRDIHGESYFVSPGVGVVRKLFIANYSKDSTGQYVILVRAIVSLTSVDGIVR